MFERFNESFGDMDFILVTGDHVAHWADPYLGDDDPLHYDAMKENLYHSAKLARTHFPETPILFAVGNHDDPHVWQAPDADTKEDYYGWLWKSWFEDIPANKQLLTGDIYNSFMKGGYYRVDIDDTLSVLVLNSIYWNDFETDPSMFEAKEQFAWMQA